MAKKSSMTFVEDFAFYEQLWNYYASNRGKIRSRYNDLTKKFLAYNDKIRIPMPSCVHLSLKHWKCMCLLRNL